MKYPIFEPKLFKICPWLLVFCLVILRGVVWGQINFTNIKPYDIVISEFMAKPLANAKLPNSEFIELYNRTKDSIQLKNLRLYNDKKLTVLPEFSLKANKYLSVYKKNKDVSFKIYGDTLALDSLFTLVNPNDVFYLSTPSGKIIDAASYDLTLYSDSKKASGGVTLERTNVNSPCEVLGWDGSNNPDGGTPGKPNSIKVKDTIPLEINRHYLINANKIGIVFNKSIDSAAIAKSSYQISNTITATFDSIVRPLFNEVILKLSSSLNKGDTYNLTLKKSLKGCVDSSTSLKSDTTLLLKVPERAKIDSIVINEILVNPATGGSRFVELYNKSKNTVFDINDLKIGNTATDVDIAIKMLLFPNEYVVLTDNPLYIQRYYKAEKFRRRIVKNKVPTFVESSDSVLLKNGSSKNPIEAFRYLKSWHNPLLANTEGVSLERINPNDSSNVKSNWQSAAQTVGFATPAQQNSQYHTSNVAASSQIFSLEKKTFSPDSDGFEDFLSINYQFDKGGYSASIFIFNDKGKLVKKLINNELLNVEGTLKWEGDTDEGLKARQGIYIVSFEWVSPTGQLKREKLACVVSGRL